MDTYLALGKEPDGLFSLGVKDSIKRTGHAAKGVEGHGSNDSEIDAICLSNEK